MKCPRMVQEASNVLARCSVCLKEFRGLEVSSVDAHVFDVALETHDGFPDPFVGGSKKEMVYPLVSAVGAAGLLVLQSSVNIKP